MSKWLGLVQRIPQMPAGIRRLERELAECQAISVQHLQKIANLQSANAELKQEISETAPRYAIIEIGGITCLVKKPKS